MFTNVLMTALLLFAAVLAAIGRHWGRVAINVALIVLYVIIMYDDVRSRRNENEEVSTDHQA